jgi:hypothetical protein
VPHHSFSTAENTLRPTAHEMHLTTKPSSVTDCKPWWQAYLDPFQAIPRPQSDDHARVTSTTAVKETAKKEHCQGTSCWWEPLRRTDSRTAAAMELNKEGSSSELLLLLPVDFLRGACCDRTRGTAEAKGELIGQTTAILSGQSITYSPYSLKWTVHS